MTRQSRLTAILSGLLVGMGLRSLADIIKQEKPSREKALLVTLLIGIVLLAATALLWAFGLI